MSVVLIEPDERGRVSLSKIPGVNAEQYIGSRLPNGSVLLQPAVLLPTAALESLVKLQDPSRRASRPGRPLREVLDRHGSTVPDDDAVEAVKAHLERRRADGARFLSDITVEERERIRNARPH